MAEHTYTDNSKNHSGRSKHYTAVEDLHELLSRYIDSLHRSSNDDDDDLRNISSADRYATDIRWYNDWLAEENLTPYSISKADVERLGTRLAVEYNGTTPRNRWRSIHDCHDYIVKIGERNVNPLEPWNDDVRQEFGMTHTPEQSKYIEDGDPGPGQAGCPSGVSSYISRSPLPV